MSNSSPNRSSGKNRTGFTLIELLVVIAIISILASMLFPAFSRAREQARKIVCISNMKQIGLGILQYNQDYDEHFPIGHPFWAALNSPPPPAAQFLVNVVDPYIKSTQIWNCPSWNGAYPGTANFVGNYDFLTGQDAKGNLLSPSNNVIGVPGTALSPSTLAALGKPSEYPLLFCGLGSQHSTSQPEMNIHAGVNDLQWQAGNGVGGTNVLYGDGHAKYIHFDFNQWDGICKTPLSG